MARTSTETYAEAIRTVLAEFNGGPVRSKDLVDAILAKGLVPNGKYAYNSILKVARDSNEFETTHGKVSLAKAGAPAAAAQE